MELFYLNEHTSCYAVTACLTPNHWKNVKSWLPCSRGEYGPVKGPPFQSYTT